MLIVLDLQSGLVNLESSQGVIFMVFRKDRFWHIQLPYFANSVWGCDQFTVEFISRLRNRGLIREKLFDARPQWTRLSAWARIRLQSFPVFKKCA